MQVNIRYRSLMFEFPYEILEIENENFEFFCGISQRLKTHYI